MVSSDADHDTAPGEYVPQDPKMPISFPGVIGGSVSVFLVGDKVKKMSLHTEAVARQSRLLHQILHGSMKEGRSKEVHWPDVDEGTFHRFAEFIYTGDYRPPSVKLQEVVPDAVAAAPIETAKQIVAEADIEEKSQLFGVQDDEVNEDFPTDSWGYGYSTGFGKKIKKDKKKVKNHNPSRLEDCLPAPQEEENQFEKLEYKTVSQITLKNSHYAPSRNSNNEDYTPVFLGHAQLYTLADERFIEPLKNLVLEKLHTALSKFVPYEARYNDIAELVRYTYKNTPCREGGMDQLRELVTKYVTYQVPQMLCSECGLELLEGIGPFARDVTPMIIKRAKF